LFAEPEENESFASILASQEEVIALLKQVKDVEEPSFAALQEALLLAPKYMEETKRIKSQIADINARMAKMRQQVAKLEAKKKAEIDLQEKKEGLLKPKE
jgi:hypothetical protein